MYLENSTPFFRRYQIHPNFHLEVAAQGLSEMRPRHPFLKMRGRSKEKGDLIPHHELATL